VSRLARAHLGAKSLDGPWRCARPRDGDHRRDHDHQFEQERAEARGVVGRRQVLGGGQVVDEMGDSIVFFSCPFPLFPCFPFLSGMNFV